MRWPFALALVVAAVQAPATRPDSITIDSGITLRAAVDKMLPLTGRTALILADAALKMEMSRLQLSEALTVSRAGAEEMLGRLLLVHGLALVPPVVDGLPWTLRSLSEGNEVRACMRTIEPSEIRSNGNRYVPLAVALPLAHANASAVAETLRPLCQITSIEWIAPAGPDRVVVLGLGPTLSVLSEKIRQMDEEADVAAAKTLEDLQARVAALEAKLAEKPGTKPGR